MSDEVTTENLEACSKIEDAESRDELLHELAGCLKKSRKAKDLNLEEIALALKLRPAYLKCLESGDWSEMPGEVYALGFLKQYASFLELDVSNSIEKLKTGHYILTKPLTFPDPPIAPNKTWVIIAALTFVVLLIMFNLIDSDEEAQNSLQTAEMGLPVAPPPSPQKTVETAGSIAEPDSQVDNHSDAPVDDVAAPEIAPVSHTYRLTAVDADVWLQLSLKQGDGDEEMLVKEVLLHPGEGTTIEHISPYLILTCGNPAALEVHIDEELVIAAGSLGESGKVLRNFKLQPSTTQ